MYVCQIRMSSKQQEQCVHYRISTGNNVTSPVDTDQWR